MKEITTRQEFLKRLKRELRFKYNKEDVTSILSDYDEFFNIEAVQGKPDHEVCAVLGNPAVIVRNLNQEMQPKSAFGKNMLSKGRITQSVFGAIVCFMLANILYRSEHAQGKSILMLLLISFPIMSVCIWRALYKIEGVSHKALTAKKDLLKIGSIHLLCFSAVLCIFLFLSNIIPNADNLPFNLKYEYTGNFVVGILYLFAAIFFGVILFGSYQFRKKSIFYYSVICHALGLLTIIFYYMNVLHTLTDINTYSLRIKESGFIYLEIIAAIALFFILKSKKEIR